MTRDLQSNAQLNPSLTRRLKTLSKVASGGVILVGLLVLAGRALDIGALKSLLAGSTTMKANTALAFCLAGLSLWLLTAEWSARSRYRLDRRIAQICACGVALLGLLTLGEYIFGWDIGIDQLLFSDTPAAAPTATPGRMEQQQLQAFCWPGALSFC